MKKAAQWLNYYAASLIDGDMFDIQYKDWEDGVFFNSLEELKNTNELSRIFRDLKRRIAKSKTSEEEHQLPIINVFISPFFISKKVERGKSINTDRTFPYWIPARLNSQGEFLPPENKSTPWVLRTSLDPIFISKNEIPTIGNVTDVYQELNIFNFNYNSWEEYWNSCENFFKKITGYRYEIYLLEEAVVTQNICLIPAKTSTIASHILNLYTSLKNEKEYPKLIKEVLSNQWREQKAIVPEEILFLSKGHYGQYNNRFPLSFSQRQSLLSFTNEQKELKYNVLAVNGPPGTGKTTLLQSIIANEMVVSALKGKKPTKVVATSANNQAITNILESFKSSDSFERWIPNIESLGTYLTSNKEDEGYQIISAGARRLEGFYFENLESTEVSLDSFNDFYINKYNNEAGTKLKSIDDVTNALRNKIIEKTTEIDSFISTLSKVGKLENQYYPLSELNSSLSELKQLKEDLKKLNNEEIEFVKYKNNEFDKFFKENKLSLFGRFSSSIKNAHQNKIALFLATSPYEALKTTNNQTDAESTLLSILNNIRDHKKLVAAKIKEKEIAFNIMHSLAEEVSSQNDKLDSLWTVYLQTQTEKAQEIHSSNIKSVSLEEKVNIILDLTLRYESFVLAVHYWEGKWLITQKNEKLTNTTGSKSRTEVFERISCLTPLFVSTFHSLPSFCISFFKADNTWQKKPIYELFDIIIVDEAGQVSPEIGVASLGFAKRALIVGDIHQIEPVWRVAYPRVDRGNLKEAGLLDEYSYEELDTKGILSTSGSLMCLAQNASRCKIPNGLGGTMLTEHRRCVNQLVAYSNEFVYSGLLKPLVGDLDYNTFTYNNDKISIPPYSYINIRGYSEKYSGSVRNILEANAIAKWIKKYAPYIVKFYSEQDNKIRNIKDCLAVVTPFAAQRRAILKEFRNLGIKDDIIVGTVHALQGAEIPMVLFSPTYGVNHESKSVFFDNGYNMFNVALTRAKHHFIVIGNMRLFQPSSIKKPSGGLAKYLFSNPSNELPSSFLLENSSIPSEYRVDTLERHQKCLSQAFNVAKRRIVIVSPFISIHALNADNLLSKIEESTSKNIDVIVYTDSCLDLINGKLKDSSRMGREALSGAGADVRILNGIHNKALAIDEDVLIEGSFNWLSAVRDKKNVHFRYEVSQIITKPEAEKQILQLLKELDSIKQ